MAQSWLGCWENQPGSEEMESEFTFFGFFLAFLAMVTY